ncbi:hypothetical protein H696_04374 [Fonticula alba]|uniref:Uncharacterized protein n=1 Tax=Fonticula alba TaxID=691883 RepID=A0A058Z3Y9_FONAL|nr:hypothetical protein H696_04374 [Fonticula alba]KCV68955.1 hypothetical protein H696_04374 [Fonticula alba]|eukprot:XP_009496526.1 hypothetical protein H696_04374 [Fonticula alba]
MSQLPSSPDDTRLTSPPVNSQVFYATLASIPPAPTRSAASDLSIAATGSDTAFEQRALNRYIMLDNISRSERIGHGLRAEVEASGAETFAERRQAGRRLRRRAAIVSAKRARAEGWFSVSPRGDAAAFARIVALHSLWQDYMRAVLLNDSNSSSISVKILKADWQGSIVSVVQSKSPTLVGKSGIVVRETAKTFELAEPYYPGGTELPGDTSASGEGGLLASGELPSYRLVRVPKRGAVFSMTVPGSGASRVLPGTPPTDGKSSATGPEGRQPQPGRSAPGTGSPPLDLTPGRGLWEVTIYGDQVCCRAAERSTRKFKGQSSIRL